jgi:molybdopterin-synthase adenylyltransferase
MRIVFIDELLEGVRDRLLSVTDHETCAVCLAHASNNRLIVSDIVHLHDTDYADRTAVSAELRPEYVLAVSQRAAATKSSLIFLHTHPNDLQRPFFSAADDAGERRLNSFLCKRIPERSHAAIVISPGGMSSRVLGTNIPATVLSVGQKLKVATGAAALDQAEIYNRQIRAFGAGGQASIKAMKVAIVGLGGTGSVTAQQLAHLGVEDFILIDFDRVDETSLNRLVGATLADVGNPKVEVAARAIKAINPGARVSSVVGDISLDQNARRLLDRDVIFGCTDSHASRAILGTIAYQYIIPVIDVGVSINVRGGKLEKITGRAQLLSPGCPCFTCLELLDSEQIRREMLTPEQRAADPYIQGAREVQPSVISLNSTMSSLAVSMFIGLVTDAPLEATFLRYDGIKGYVRPVTGPTDADCYVCSPKNGLAKGDQWPLPTRS